MQQSKDLLSIIIPVFRSAQILPELVSEIDGILLENDIHYEIVLVDDCSDDGTWETIEYLSARNSNIIGIQLLKNVGQFEATLIGIRHSSGSLIVNMDDDMEHPPSEIIKLVNAIQTERDYKIVFGMSKDKYKIKGNDVLPEFRNRVVNFLWGKYPTDSFRIFRRDVVFRGKTFLPETVILEAYLKHNLHKSFVGYTEVKVNPRLMGNSNYGGFKKLRLFWKMTPYFWFSGIKRN